MRKVYKIIKKSIN